MSRTIPTGKRSCWPTCGTDGWIAPPSGQTSGPLAVWSGVAVWTALLRDSPASRTPVLACDKVQSINGTCGRRCGEPLARFDQDTCSWKTFTAWLSGMEDSQHTLGPSLLSLPAWGMTHGGELYRLVMLAHRTDGIDGSVWPTPTVQEAPNQKANIRKWGGLNTATLMAESRLWATPTARDYRTGEQNQPVNGMLGRQAPWTLLAGNDDCENIQTTLPLSEAN